MNAEQLLYVGFNKRIAALDRQTGEIVWQWMAPDGSGFVSLLLDRDRLFVAVNGYTYGLDPITGAQLWVNRMKGFGYGTTSLAVCGGHTSHSILGAAKAAQQQAATSATAAGS